MNPLWLLVIGLILVLGGILWLRLHPFLALILGALGVGALTGGDQLRAAMASKYRGDLFRAAVDEQVEREIADLKAQGQAFDPPQIRQAVKLAMRSRADEFAEASEAKAQDFVRSTPTLKRLLAAFGDTCEKVGLIIAMACVIGRCLLASGAAERIVRGALSVVGQRGAPLAFSASSFVLSIPVFFDSVFLLSLPLAKATWLKVRKNYLLFILALITGGTMTHSLVPPTPGPLFVAEELGVSIGTMIGVGMVIGMGCSLAGLLYAHWLNARMEIPVRETPEALAQLEELSGRDLGQLPPLGWSLLPVLLPVALISGATIYKGGLDPTQPVPAWVGALGDKNIALTIAAALAMLIAAMRLQDRKALTDQIQQALQEAGLIILICCAGGAFGAMLQQSGIGPYIHGLTGNQPLDLGLLPLAFLVTTVIRAAQGSATVAMFTGVAIVGSLVPDISSLSYHPVYVAVAIGCGSKPFPWMNDSGFWVISKMSGMTEQETLKTFTPLVTLMGFTGIALTLLGAKFFPMVP